MALSLIGGAQAVGGLFGGGGARAPRMNAEQKQLLQSQANLNNALAERIRGGAGQCNQAQQGCFGRPCGQGHQCGPIGHQGMNGCGNGGFGPGPMQQIMGGFGQLMDMMGGMGGMGGFPGGFGGGFGGFPGGGFGGGFGGFPGGACGNQMGINLNINF